MSHSHGGGYSSVPCDDMFEQLELVEHERQERASVPSPSAPPPSPPPAAGATADKALTTLMDMGFSQHLSRNALLASGGDLEGALARLLAEEPSAFTFSPCTPPDSCQTPPAPLARRESVVTAPIRAPPPPRAPNSEDDGLVLHRAVWFGDTATLRELASTANVDTEDHHGNTPLHLALLLGRREEATILLDRGASVHRVNRAGWTALQEASCLGDRELLLSLYLSSVQADMASWQLRFPALVRELANVGDFYMEIKFDVKSWIPLVSRFTPHDVLKVYKHAACLRVDMTLLRVEGTKSISGNRSYIFRCGADSAVEFSLVDHVSRTYEDGLVKLRAPQEERELNHIIDRMLTSHTARADLRSSRLEFKPKKTLFGKLKKQHVGRDRRLAQVFKMSGLEFVAVLRDSTSPSAGPPLQAERDYERYFDRAGPALPATAGISEDLTKVNATVWISQEFPLSIQQFLPILDLLSPLNDLISKIRDFLSIRIPPGFPVKIEIPVAPTVHADVLFDHFVAAPQDPALFVVPPEYRHA